MENLKKVVLEVLRTRETFFEEYQKENSQDQSGDCGDKIYRDSLEACELVIAKMIKDSGFTEEEVEKAVSEKMYDDEFETEAVFASVNGKTLGVTEEQMRGMAGEPCYYLKYSIDGEDVDYDTFVVELSEASKATLDFMIEDISDQNDSNAMAWAN